MSLVGIIRRKGENGEEFLFYADKKVTYLSQTIFSANKLYQTPQKLFTLGLVGSTQEWSRVRMLFNKWEKEIIERIMKGESPPNKVVDDCFPVEDCEKTAKESDVLYYDCYSDRCGFFDSKGKADIQANNIAVGSGMNAALSLLEHDPNIEPHRIVDIVSKVVESVGNGADIIDLSDAKTAFHRFISEKERGDSLKQIW